jgi:hypothetical protein
MLRWVAAGSLLLALATPAGAAPPAWKGLINDWFDSAHIDRTWPCSAYPVALKHLPDRFPRAKRDLARNLRERKCSGAKGVRGALWIGPSRAGHAARWPYVAGGALLLVSALGARRARRPTPA